MVLTKMHYERNVGFSKATLHTVNFTFKVRMKLTWHKINQFHVYTHFSRKSRNDKHEPRSVQLTKVTPVPLECLRRETKTTSEKTRQTSVVKRSCSLCCEIEYSLPASNVLTPPKSIAKRQCGSFRLAHLCYNFTWQCLWNENTSKSVLSVRENVTIIDKPPPATALTLEWRCAGIIGIFQSTFDALIGCVRFAWRNSIQIWNACGFFWRAKHIIIWCAVCVYCWDTWFGSWRDFVYHPAFSETASGSKYKRDSCLVIAVYSVLRRKQQQPISPLGNRTSKMCTYFLILLHLPKSL